jgi:hypothetical protein
MADMKSLVLLPLALLAASCIPADPYRDQRPPMRNGEPYYPYGPGGGPGRQAAGAGAGTETGTFEPIPPAGGTAATPPPPRNAGPQAPQIDPYGNPDPDAAPQPIPRQDYPVAKRTANPNEVISPFAPYNVIDVEGFKSGQLAKDPSNKKIFRIP